MLVIQQLDLTLAHLEIESKCHYDPFPETVVENKESGK